ncbi:hypothetical protein GWI34_34975, partial [Actinomadura sp. DSM 109109]|nr:hypothetical protein [Actinomadura lepetitiana]
MSEQRPHASGRAIRDEDEPSMEWLGELKSDADDPELQPVNPAVTEGFKAILEEEGLETLRHGGVDGLELRV